MKKYVIVVITVCFIIPVVLFAQMEIITIDNKVFKTKSRSPVKFNHFNHMAIEGGSCTDCHHRFENGRNVIEPDELSDDNKSIYCSHCHSNPSELKKAYHRSCIKCHEAMVKNSKTAGPRLCGECHNQ